MAGQSSHQRVSGSLDSGIPQLTDINQFASMVDPRKISAPGQQQKRPSKQSNFHSKVASPPAVSHQRATSLQNSSNNGPVTPKEIKNKLNKLPNAEAKKQSSPGKSMSNTMFNESKPAAWFKPNVTKSTMHGTTGQGGFPTL